MPRQPQSLSQSLIVNSLATLVFVTIVSAVAFVAPATAQNAPVQNASWFSSHGGWWGSPTTAAEHCEEGIDGFVEELVEHADDEVSFTTKQQASWDDLIAAIRTGGMEITTFCTRVDEARDAGPAAAPERLAMAEDAISVGLTVMQTIRPAFDTFYATLDAEQKEMLDNVANHRRRGWWH